MNLVNNPQQLEILHGRSEIVSYSEIQNFLFVPFSWQTEDKSAEALITWV